MPRFASDLDAAAPGPEHRPSRPPLPHQGPLGSGRDRARVHPLSWFRQGLVGGLLWLSLALVVVLTGPLGAQAVIQEAVFAGGCFWCLEHDLAQVPGVLEAVSGYSGGSLANPSYKQVSAGGTGHQEAVRVRFDDTRVSYATLLRAYWRNVDALDAGGQFCDRGASYRPVIFTAGDSQASQARLSLGQAAQELKRSPTEIKVQLKALTRFWLAEAYHQNYAGTHKVSYNYYRWACGRDQRLDQLWGKRARSSQAWAG